MLLLVPAVAAVAGCRSSEYVTRDELAELMTVPALAAEPPDATARRLALGRAVEAAFSAPDAATRAAAAHAAAAGSTDRLADTIGAIDRALTVCANNLRHADTPGYRGIRARPAPDGSSRFETDVTQGELRDTRRNLDVAIQGDGFFRVHVRDETGDGFAYTRDGNFFIDSEGTLVLGLGDGFKLDPPISLPPDATEVNIAQNGVISFRRPGGTEELRAGALEVARFRNPEALKVVEGSILVETEESGEPEMVEPGENGAGIVLQGFIEDSNVDPTREQLRIRFLERWRDAVMAAVSAGAAGRGRQRS